MLQLTKRFPQKRAFITGAASGLGKAFAQILAKEGWQLGLADISRERLSKTVDELSGGGLQNVSIYVFDVADSHAFEDASKQFLDAYKGIDLLINNAGVGEGSAFEDYSIENWNWITGINQLAVVYGCHFFIPSMLNAKNGHIVNISSAASFSNAPNMSPYNVTKAAVLSLSETLFAEFKHRGVQVSVVMPTFFRTNIDRFARGGEAHKETAHKLLATSGIEADEMALKILKAAGRKQFYIVLPYKAKMLFAIKRWFPSLFLKFTSFISAHQNKLNERLNARYQKLPKDKREIT